jgi:hypothetical protein
MSWLWMCSLPALGSLFLWVSISFLSNLLKLSQSGIRTQGKVIGLSVDGADSRDKFPVVSFKDDSGKTVVVRSKIGSTLAPKKGAAIDICYDPNDPKNAILGPLWVNGLLIFMFGCLGLAMLGGAVYTAKEAFLNR